MKKIKYLSGLILAAFLIAQPALWVGCGTTPYKAVATTQVSVQGAVQVWGAYVRSAHPPVEQEYAVKDAYEKWQTAMAAVCDAGKAYAAAQQAGAANQSVLLAALESAITNSDLLKQDVLDLITKFGVKLP